MRDRLYKMIGQVGTIAALAVAVLSYIIWRFNPAFRLPAKKAAIPVEEIVPAEEQISEKVEWNDEAKPVKGNSVKEAGVMMNIPVMENNDLKHEMNIVEKEDEKTAPVVVPPVKEEKIILPVAETVVLPVKPAKSETDLALEIKSVPENRGR